MAVMNRLLQLLCVTLIASSTVAAPAPERAKLGRGTVSRVEVREFIEHIDRDAVQSLVEKLRTTRADLKDRDFALANGLTFVRRQDISTGVSDTVTDGPTLTETETTDPASTTEPDTGTDTDTSSQTGTEPTSSEPEPTSTEPDPTSTEPDPTSTDTPTSTTSSEPTSSTSTTEPTSTETSSTTEPTSSEEPTTTATTTTEPSTSSTISTFTSTNADGELVTVTSTAYVNPTQGPDDGSTATGPEPGLQTNGASASGYAKELFAMMGGAAVAVAVI
ncbi:hypothetical protein ASPSYDRAFT_1030026 [Aspergillus sydowii CBS 593.65]|uniref:GPI anchored cell wall protein n=1 Tax=Aspergillus sydowii CBS 593.65 TaxID=1036612 RepID=A0A1L9TFD0_9EURO|nr:uncharacterized protein ASPSYDRAFT_1030026 [Aspergillus sydowii CBS 593.65]OJJ58144.1 hypothetical protein ASPSYDRAFT_1030026 [Aspergillus sydowii CBS 593.65]